MSHTDELIEGVCSMVIMTADIPTPRDFSVVAYVESLSNKEKEEQLKENRDYFARNGKCTLEQWNNNFQARRQKYGI